MIDNAFADSNIFLYLFEKGEKRRIASEILNAKPVISVQVVNENIFASIKKLKLTKENAAEHGRSLLKTCAVKNITPDTIDITLDILLKYQYRYWDCMIIASALENNCDVLYSEDMQHLHVIKYAKQKLTIINPFI